MILQSPLRYPGGKAKLFPLFKIIIEKNSMFERRYSEPYAGGAGLAINLLLSGYSNEIHLNDFDPAIYAFWYCIVNENNHFIKKLESANLSVDEWRRQKEIWSTPENYSQLDLGFATFYLNRTNRSGIIEGAGPIGGYNQGGNYKIDARFNKKNLISNIRTLGQCSKNIKVTNLDAKIFIKNNLNNYDLMYLDPPYYIKGRKLYRNFYSHEDHASISDILSNSDGNWVLSYDDAPQIRDIYQWSVPVELKLQYSLANAGWGREVIYYSKSLVQPEKCAA